MALVSPANCSGFLTSEIREKAISRLKQTSCRYREPSTLKSSNFHYKHLNIYYVPQAHREKALAPHSSTLARKIPWTEDPGGLQSMGSRRVRHDWATSLSLFTFMHWRRKWQPTWVFLPGESQGRGRTVGQDYSDLAVQAHGTECLVDPHTTKWSAYKASLHRKLNEAQTQGPSFDQGQTWVAEPEFQFSRIRIRGYGWAGCASPRVSNWGRGWQLKSRLPSACQSMFSRAGLPHPDKPLISHSHKGKMQISSSPEEQQSYFSRLGLYTMGFLRAQKMLSRTPTHIPVSLKQWPGVKAFYSMRCLW